MDANVEARLAELASRVRGLREKIKTNLAKARGVPISEVTEEMANEFADKLLRDLAIAGGECGCARVWGARRASGDCPSKSAVNFRFG
jgi:hypothetical protein